MKTIPKPHEVQPTAVHQAFDTFSKLTRKQQAVLTQIMSDPDSLDDPRSLCERAGYVVQGKTHAGQIIASIQDRIGTVFADQYDLTVEKLFKTLLGALDAERKVCSTVKRYRAGKLQKVEPEVMSLGPDHKVRLAAVAAIAKLTGFDLTGSPPKQDKGKSSGMSPETIEKLQARRSFQDDPTSKPS